MWSIPQRRVGAQGMAGVVGVVPLDDPLSAVSEPGKRVARIIKRHQDGITIAVVDKVTDVRAESINAGSEAEVLSARVSQPQVIPQRHLLSSRRPYLYPVGVTPRPTLSTRIPVEPSEGDWSQIPSRYRHSLDYRRNFAQDPCAFATFLIEGARRVPRACPKRGHLAGTNDILDDRPAR